MFREPRAVSIVINVVNEMFNGIRLIDIIRKQLIEFVKNFEEEDLLYLYHPDSVDMLNGRGPQIGCVGNYETDGYKMQSLPLALKQSYYVIAAQDEDYRRVLYYITNQVSDNDIRALKKTFKLNRSMVLQEPCDIVVIYSGMKNTILEEVCAEKLIHVESIHELNLVMQSVLE